MDKYYYHVTSKEILPIILKEGLKPCVGENSKSVGDDTPAIYLCRKKDINYWKILLGKDVVLRIENVNIADEDKWEYGEYNEYSYHEPISPDKIKRVYFKKDNVKQMRALCLSYISTISYATECCARFYNDTGSDTLETLAGKINTCLIGLSRLDFSVLSRKEIKEELKFLGENGAYTFVDNYMLTGLRLYQQLINYPEDETFEKRLALYNNIKKQFHGCLKVETGGWIG